MTALARSIGTQDTVLYLSSSLDVGSLPAPYLVDAECILVTGGDMQSQVFVSRGQFGTAPETHDVGATLVSGWGSTNGPVTLAQVLANRNDTGGIGIVNQVSNSAADASTTATDSFFSTSASHVAQLDGAGSASAYSEAIGAGGAADAHRSAITSTDANAIATTLALTDGVGTADASTAANSVDGNATATTTATASGTGSADATLYANGSGGSASIGPIANSTRAEIQVNSLPLITTGSGAPGGTFVSLLYVDTTAVTGGGYCWDFVSGAYIKIGTV